MKSSEDFGQTRSSVGYTFVELPLSDGLTENFLVDPRRFQFGSGKEDRDAYNALLLSDPVVTLDSDPVVILELKNDGVLCKKFARIAKAADIQSAILEFANEYGFLGAFDVFPTPSYGDIKAESEVTWIKEAGAMNFAMERHDLIMKCRKIDRDRNGAKYLEARDALRRRYKGVDFEFMGKPQKMDDEWLIRQAFANTPNLLRYCDAGDFENAELAYISLLIDRKLRKYTSLKLSWDSKAAKPTMQYRAHTLLGAMWLQFAEYVTEIRQLNFCRVCGEPIPIMKTSSTPDGRRPRSRDTCSGTCRTRASRAAKSSERNASV